MSNNERISPRPPPQCIRESPHGLCGQCQNGRFLIIEDCEPYARLVAKALQEVRPLAEVRWFGDGEQAWTYLQSVTAVAEHSGPDLILLDLHLPGLSGHELLRQLKVDESLRLIPVVVLSSSQAADDRVGAYRAYANSYVIKPADFDGLRRLAADVARYWICWNERAPAFEHERTRA